MEAETIRPFSDNVLVRVEYPETTESGLVVLPSTAEHYRQIDGAFARVVAVGPGPAFRANCEKCARPRDPWPMEIATGDLVVLDSERAGDVIMVDGVEHRLVRQAEILGVVEG